MRKLCIALLMLMAVPVLAQQPTPLGPNNA